MAEVAKKVEGYAVSQDCIACDACCDDFPEIFKMNADHTRAIPYAEIGPGKYNPWDIIYDCPVDAISLIKGELPPPPADKKPKSATEKKEEATPAEVTDNRPWEIRWEEARKRGPESYWERMKRYGQAYSMEETLTQYKFRFELPETVPEHPLKYKLNLPHTMPDYQFDVQVNGGGLKLKGWLEDPHVKKLTGMVNSFPDRFLREIDLPVPIKGVSKNYNPQEKILDITVEKA